MAKLVEYITPTWIREKEDECVPIYDPSIDGERIELVRCKDCKYWSAERINDYNKCRRWINVGVKNFATMGSWFCADGERRKR